MLHMERHSYLVSCWRYGHEAAWHYVVEDVVSNERHTFRDLSALFEFLRLVLFEPAELSNAETTVNIAAMSAQVADTPFPANQADVSHTFLTGIVRRKRQAVATLKRWYSQLLAFLRSVLQQMVGRNVAVPNTPVMAAT